MADTAAPSVKQSAKLTDKQRAIFNFICRHIQERGYPPAIRDICDEFSISSPNGVMCHLRALQKKGYIQRIQNQKKGKRLRAQARGIVVPGVTAGGFSLPLMGVVAAGQAIEAHELQERLELKELFGGDDLFVVRVRGNSMIDGHIADGDYVVIRQRDTCENGDKVVAMIDNAMTLKKYVCKKDQIRLEPMNDHMEPIIVDPSRQDIRILGTLVGVIRKY